MTYSISFLSRLWTEKCDQACANLKYACKGLYHSENDQNWMKSYGGAKTLNARWSIEFARLRRNKLLRGVMFCSKNLLKRKSMFLLVAPNILGWGKDHLILTEKQ